ncbi:DUF779 domain-containing protein [Pseudobacter ginsenosidimutans]|uniref:DUF779 domain-containing protein n=2 Tax=Pseudobacter ginsenosidimutans TaxID=661488 RepID=A0A4Q7N226_9BACT|nr:DUF779 domain-containing protein [Pseudobacter ginsenosidimutans]RZS75503.1 hypothetical protein EV199_1371 [Pseudobacter ginsenosidimutans]
MPVPRVVATDRAVLLINSLIELHGPLMFHQSGGCCDGSQPMCFQEGEFKTGGSDVCLGQVQGCKFYMSADQFEYWKHTQLILDVTPGRGSSFSLEIPMGVRFYILSVLFSEEELKNLAPLMEPVEEG